MSIEPPTEYSTRSTMKVILLFALFGLSFYKASADPTWTTKAAYADDDDCLRKACWKSADFVKALGKLLCEHEEAKKVYRQTRGTAMTDVDIYAAFKSFTQELIKSVHRLGCRLEMLDTDNIFADSSKVIREATKEVGDDALKILDALHLDDEARKFLCALAGKTLNKECTEKLIASTAPGTIDDLRYIYSKLDEKAPNDAAARLRELLEEFECFLDTALKTEGALEKGLDSVGGAVQSVVGELLSTLQKAPVAKALV